MFASYLVIWLFAYLVVWLFGCLVIWLFGYLVVWLFGFTVISSLLYVGIDCGYIVKDDCDKTSQSMIPVADTGGVGITAVTARGYNDV